MKNFLFLFTSALFIYSCSGDISDDSPQDQFKYLKKQYMKIAEETSMNDLKQKKNIEQAAQSLARSIKNTEFTEACKVIRISYEEYGSFKSIFSVFSNLNLTPEQNEEMFPYWEIKCSEKNNEKGSFRYSLKIHDMFMSEDEIILLESLSKNDKLNFKGDILASSAKTNKYNFYLALKFENMPYQAEFCFTETDTDSLLKCKEEVTFNDKKTITFW